jgi:hypothetical protein
MRDVLADFLKNAVAQELTIAQDNGLYRHLKIRNKAGHQFNWFDIITWPGVLTINGDHGTWVFSRIDDMFEFFRLSPREGEELRINESYWAEKLQACDRTTGAARQFDADTFRAAIIESLDGYGIDEEYPAGFKEQLIEALGEEVFIYDGEHEIRDALNNFKYEDLDASGGSVKRLKFEFSDTWEIHGKRYCYRYTYCLYAIVWAIQQYDAARTAPREVAA